MPTDRFPTAVAIMNSLNPIPRTSTVNGELLDEMDMRVRSVTAVPNTPVAVGKRTLTIRRTFLALLGSVSMLLVGTQLATGSGLLPEFWKSSVGLLNCDVNGAGAVKVSTLALPESRTAEYWIVRRGDRVADIAFVAGQPQRANQDSPPNPGSVSCDPNGRSVDAPTIDFTSASTGSGPTEFLFYGWLPGTISEARVEFSNGWTVSLRPQPDGYVLSSVIRQFESTPVMVSQTLVNSSGATEFVRKMTEDNSKWERTTP